MFRRAKKLENHIVDKTECSRFLRNNSSKLKETEKAVEANKNIAIAASVGTVAGAAAVIGAASYGAPATIVTSLTIGTMFAGIVAISAIGSLIGGVIDQAILRENIEVAQGRRQEVLM